MKGLLLKDFLIMKTYWKTYGLLLAFYALFAFMGNSSFFATMMTVILFILPLSSFSADEMARWDKFAVALPGGRRAVVRAKYQFLFVTLVGAFVLSCVVNLLLSLVDRDGSGTFPELMLTTLACTAVGLLANCVIYPLLFKFGSQKGRIAMVLACGVIFAAFAIAMLLLSFSGGTPFDHLVPVVSPVVTAAAVIILLAAAVVVSYRVSRRIYDNKEF